MVDGQVERHGPQGSVNDPGTGSPCHKRRDGQAQLVDHPGVGELSVEGRSAFRQDHSGAAAVKLGEDLGRLGPGRAESHHLGHRCERLDRSGWGIPAGEDHRQVVAGALIGEQRQVQAEVQACADNSQPGTGGASGGTLRGSSIPFAATRDEREETGDPRLSIEERYASRDSFLHLIEDAARQLVSDGYLLEEDVEPLVAQAGEHYEVMAGRVQEVQPVGD